MMSAELFGVVVAPSSGSVMPIYAAEDSFISISKNETVYVRATDSEGTTYEQNRSIKCYDSEKPTLISYQRNPDGSHDG